MRVLHVAAPNYRWAKTHMDEWFPELRPVRGWVYLKSPRSLMGLDERNVVVVFDRPAIAQDMFEDHYWWQLMLQRFETVVWVDT